MPADTSLPLLGKDDVYPVLTRDGSATLFSKRFQSTFHSLNGAVSESRHVFVQHGLLTQSFRRKIHVLEFGFGTGLNALLTYLFARKHQTEIQYTALEPYGISWDVIQQLEYPAYLAAPESENALRCMHEQSRGNLSPFHFRKYIDLDQVSNLQVDCIYFDAFDPSVQNEAWNGDIFRKLFALTSGGGCLVTYCARGQVRRDLEQAGFAVERLPGAPGKRQMLRAIRPSMQD